MSKAKAERTPLEKLTDVTDIATSAGNFDASAYHYGMANGLILALAIMSGETPEYLKAPKSFLRDNEADATLLAGAQVSGLD